MVDPEQSNGPTDLVPADSTANQLAFGDQLTTFAESFASICSADISEDLSSEHLRDQLVLAGMPRGLLDAIGDDVIELITRSRTKLKVIADEESLREILMGRVREDVIASLTKHKDIVLRYGQLKDDPIESLRILQHIFSSDDLSMLTDEEIQMGLLCTASFARGSEHALLSVIAARTCSHLCDQGHTIEVKDNTMFRAKDGDDVWDILKAYLKEQYPNINLIIQSSVIGPYLEKHLVNLSS